MASITVFKTQIKIFEKKFLADSAHESAGTNKNNLTDQAEKVFAPPHELNDSSKVNLSIQQAAKTKASLQNNINRVDLLTDSKIADIKKLMNEAMTQIMGMSKRIMCVETEMYKKEYEQLPTDVLALTKTEFELRQSLALMIAEASETKDWLQKEFKRLRREHYGNLSEMDQIRVRFDQMSGKLKLFGLKIL